MSTISVPLRHHQYDIILAEPERSLDAWLTGVLPRASRFLIVADENTEPLADQVMIAVKRTAKPTTMVIVQAGEETKSLHWASELYDELIELGADRKTVVVAVGGGVIGDLAGFIASTFHRGLSLIMIPTTLLAMVDSSVGGKVGINHPKGKNLIGAFYQPHGVWIDLRYLATLPEREYLSGLAEVVKYGVILDPELLAFLEENTQKLLARDAETVKRIVQRSCELKARVVLADEKEETGQRAILNFGHTFAHAFESVAGYGAWLHGEAVSAGMVCAAKLATRLGLLPDSSLTTRLVSLLKQLELPIAPLPEWNRDELLAAMRRDKKNQAGTITFVLPRAVGQIELVPVTDTDAVLAVLTGPS
jgi:3-dehydroquinate synthase